MTPSDKIPGTEVPDNAIHRASLWLERLKFGDTYDERGGPELAEPDWWERFLLETGLHAVLEPDEIKAAANYYGESLASQLLGGRVSITIPNPAGEGWIGAQAIFATLWADAFMHGVATAQRRSAQTNEERQRHG
jgi:hypothetical protein